MDVNNPWTARLLALEYTRDRTRAAQDARDARRTREPQVTDVPDRDRPTSAPRRWWGFVRRPCTV